MVQGAVAASTMSERKTESAESANALVAVIDSSGQLKVVK